MENNDFKKVVRDIDDIKKYLELVYKEREILEDIQGSIRHLQEIILANQTHQDNSKKDLKADIKDVSHIVEAKVDEVQQVIDDKTIVVKSSKDSILKKVMGVIQK